jgi:hypothetical protein
MSALSELKAITPTANAKAVVATKAMDVTSLTLQVQRAAGELQVLLKQLIAVHPSGGGDAANLASLNTILSEIV